MNILLTSSGRRNSLLELFEQAALPYKAKVFISDIDGLAPTLYDTEHVVQLPHVKDPSYLASLLKVVQEKEISLIVPTIDPELCILAKGRKQLASAGAFALVSSERFCMNSADKWLTHQMCKANDLASPASWISEHLRCEELPEQLFIKPRFGSASIDSFAVHCYDLGQALLKVENPIVQEQLIGDEITIDAFFDFDSQPIHYVPRKRLRTLAGESIQGVTLDDAPFNAWLLKCMKVFSEHGAVGPVTFQAFLTERGPVLTDINPRFGGGYPLAYAAGGHYPDWLMMLLHGKHVRSHLGHYKRGLHMVRTFREIFTQEPLW